MKNTETVRRKRQNSEQLSSKTKMSKSQSTTILDSQRSQLFEPTKCATCGEFDLDQELLRCAICEHCYHADCVNIDDETHGFLRLMSSFKWSCNSCIQAAQLTLNSKTQVKSTTNRGKAANKKNNATVSTVQNHMQTAVVPTAVVQSAVVPTAVVPTAVVPVNVPNIPLSLGMSGKEFVEIKIFNELTEQFNILIKRVNDLESKLESKTNSTVCRCQVTSNKSNVVHGSNKTDVSNNNKSYCDVVAAPVGCDATDKTPINSDKFNSKQEILKIVSKELRIKELKARNVIVHGLCQTDEEDSDLFQAFCFANIDLTPEVKACRRLGDKLENKIQPLLVTFHDAEAASLILNKAKVLRTSKNAYVRSNVYFNPDLTKAEANEAFERRSKKRLSQKQTNGVEMKDITDTDVQASQSTSNGTDTSPPFDNRGRNPKSMQDVMLEPIRPDDEQKSDGTNETEMFDGSTGTSK